MIDASWYRTAVAVVIVIAVVTAVVAMATAFSRRQVLIDQRRLADEVRTRLADGQRELLTQMRFLVRIILREAELRHGAAPAVREPAEDEQPEEPEQTEQDLVAAIVAEVQAAPYAPVQVWPDLPEDVRVLPVIHPEGPVIVRGPAVCEEESRRARGTLQGLAAVPVVGALIRYGTTAVQGTTALSSATIGGAAMATVALAPVPPGLALERPPAVVVTLPGHDVHQQPVPAPAHSQKPRAPAESGPEDQAVPETIPAEPVRRRRPPLVDQPPAAPVEPPVMDEPARPDPSPAPTLTASPAPVPVPSLTGTPSPTGSPSPSRLITPTATATGLPA